MEWNSNLGSFVSRPDPSCHFLYNYNYDQFPGMDQIKLSAMMAVEAQQGLAHHLPSAMDKIDFSYGNINRSRDKKNRLTNEQLESLERSFQEEIKLDPERKMKLSRELGLQPRQIAVWFQNRRARWKAKQLEHLYESLRRDFHVISREKQLLQEEVVKLKAILRERGSSKNQVSGMESTSATRGRPGKPQDANHYFQTDPADYVLHIEGHSLAPVASSSWPCPNFL